MLIGGEVHGALGAYQRGGAARDLADVLHALVARQLVDGHRRHGAVR